MRTLLLCALLSGFLSPVCAEEKPVPREPYVMPLPAKGHWRIDFHVQQPEGAAVPATPASAPAQLVALDFVKSGRFLRVTQVFSDGRTRSADTEGNSMLEHTGSGWHRSTLNGGVPPYPYYSAGFPLADWIGADSFKDVVRYRQVECFHYANGDREAWIAVDSMRPAGGRQAATEAVYQFLETPDSLPDLSPDERALLQAVDDSFKP